MNVLSIAGSDPSSGAGIQGDLRTFSAIGIYGHTAITAITNQDTKSFFGVEPVSPSLIRGQIRSILKDFQIDAIKIGMVYDKQTVRAINSELADKDIPIILDPIFKSTTGGILQKQSAFSDFKRLLIPLAHIITPNIIEAEKISGIKIKSHKDLRNAAIRIQKIGARNVVIKGGHFQKGSIIIDLLLEGNKFHVFSHKRIPFQNHGGGCTFSAALCAGFTREKNVIDAVEFARKFTLESIKNSIKVGKGLPIVKPISNGNIELALSKAISNLVSITEVHELIPECQTNFVYSKPNPTSLHDIMGLEGRIVRTGRSVTVAGKLKFGGSRHVASAVLSMTKKFPTIRSALNIKYDENIIRKSIAKKFRVSYYDRNLQPVVTKSKEGTTIPWGVSKAINRTKSPPDIIFNKGSLGKEPMILIFGKNPVEVLGKVMKII